MVFAAVFALVVGVGMIGQWILFLATGQVPELETEPLRIRFHLAAEFTTALALFVGGLALLTDQPWGRWFYLLAAGMLLYTVIVSPGYFAEKGQWAFVGMFAVVLLLALVSIILVV
jgi:peptidoglycan/LPS O-acetylase OafA/YrhL